MTHSKVKSGSDNTVDGYDIQRVLFFSLNKVRHEHTFVGKKVETRLHTTTTITRWAECNKGSNGIQFVPNLQQITTQTNQ